MIRPDHVVVGAGAAGCVAATRLAEAGASVTLVEAGGPVAPEPGDGSRLFLEGRNWPYRVNLRTADARSRSRRARWAEFPYPVGRALGGSTAVNGCLSMHAPGRDFDAWAAPGLTRWTGAGMARWQRRVDEWWPTTTADPEHLHPVDMAFLQACRGRGVPTVDLRRGLAGPGVGAIPTTTRDGHRLDAARVLLSSPPPTLTVRTDVHARRLRTRHGRVLGVEVRGPQRVELVETDSVILAAGALGTPAILQHSGIGDPDELRDAGIAVTHALPGVGRNLHDHVTVVIWAQTTHAERVAGRWREVGAALNSGSNAPTDVLVGPVHDVQTETIPALRDRAPAGLVGMSCMLMRPRSRGQIRVTTPDPARLPQVDLALLDEPADLEHLADGVRIAWELLHEIVDADRLVQVQSWTERVVQSTGARRRATRELAAPGWHATGSARMGPPSDPYAVVDDAGRVHGVAGLRIVDASTHPSIVGVPTAATTAAVAERLSDDLLRSESARRPQETYA